MKKNKKGFTLAEVLISAFILGIVVLLLTNIMRKTDAEGKADELHFLNIYKNLHLVMKTEILRNSSDDFNYETACSTESNKNKCLSDLVSKRLSVMRNVKAQDIDSKFSHLYNISSDAEGFILLGGSFILFENANSACATTQEVLAEQSPKNDYCWRIYIDVNGYAKPNQIGEDQFAVPVYKNGLMQPSMNGAKDNFRNNINDEFEL